MNQHSTGTDTHPLDKVECEMAALIAQAYSAGMAGEVCDLYPITPDELKEYVYPMIEQHFPPRKVALAWTFFVGLNERCNAAWAAGRKAAGSA